MTDEGKHYFQFTITCKVRNTILLEEDLRELPFGASDAQMQFKVKVRSDDQPEYVTEFSITQESFDIEEAAYAAMTATKQALTILLYKQGNRDCVVKGDVKEYILSPTGRKSNLLKLGSTIESSGSITVKTYHNDFEGFTNNLGSLIFNIKDPQVRARLSKAIEIYHSAHQEKTAAVRFILCVVSVECLTPSAEVKSSDSASLKTFLSKIRDYAEQIFNRGEIPIENLEWTELQLRLKPKRRYKEGKKSLMFRFIEKHIKSDGSEEAQFFSECLDLRNTYIHGHKDNSKKIDEDIQAKMRQKAYHLSALVSSLLSSVIEEALQQGET